MSMIVNDGDFKQGILFDGMTHDKKHPTDIDAMVELNNEAYYFVELKRLGSDIRTGQRILFERLCDALYYQGKEAYTLLAHHDDCCLDQNRDIILSKCIIDMVYYPMEGRWVQPDRWDTVGQFDAWFYKRFDGENNG